MSFKEPDLVKLYSCFVEQLSCVFLTVNIWFMQRFNMCAYGEPPF